MQVMPCIHSQWRGALALSVHHLLLLGRAMLVPGVCWELPASGEALGKMPAKEKAQNNNLEQLQNTCPEKHHQILPAGPCRSCELGTAPLPAAWWVGHVPFSPILLISRATVLPRKGLPPSCAGQRIAQC